jgi:iron complex transport system substrate-binding protein
MFRIVVCSLFFTTTVFAAEVIDDANHRITLSHPAKRIISLAPDLTELLFAAGAGASVVGVVDGSDFPAAAKKIPIIARYNSLNSEAILTLQPDLIVAWAGGSSQSRLDQLVKMGVPVFFSQQRRVSDIPRTLHKFGLLAGTEKIADVAAEKFSARYELLQQRYAHKKTLTVFYEIWQHPLITISKASWISQMISSCGGKNIFSDTKGVAPEVSLEAVIVANPDVIVSTAANKEWENFWSHWTSLKAIKNNRLFTINSDLLDRAGPRLLDGMEMLCRDLESSRLPKPII